MSCCNTNITSCVQFVAQTTDRVLDSVMARNGDRTLLSWQNLIHGAVDVDWFARLYKVLGKEK
ncbi:hypothetical protein [Scytonema sp. NUACC21]